MACGVRKRVRCTTARDSPTSAGIAQAKQIGCEEMASRLESPTMRNPVGLGRIVMARPPGP